MIYEVVRGDDSYYVDDLLLLMDQSESFQQEFSKCQKKQLSGCLVVDFDNAEVFVFSTQRVLVTYKDNYTDDENI